MKQTVVLPPFPNPEVSVAVVGRWHKRVGEAVVADHPLVEVWTETTGFVDVGAPVTGTLARIVAVENEAVEVGEPLAVVSVVPGLPTQIPPLFPAPPARVPTQDEEIVPLPPVEGRRATHMAGSWRVAPHVHTVVAVDLSEVTALIARLQTVSLGVLPFVVKAVADALAHFPAVNAEWIDNAIVCRKKNVHIAVAVAPSVAPVVRDADKKSLLTLAREMDELSPRARRGDGVPLFLRGATFTITHPGARRGALFQTPILHQPQAALLSVGALVKTPALVDGTLAVRDLLHLCLVTDARVIDDETAADFLADIQTTLEETRFLFP